MSLLHLLEPTAMEASATLAAVLRRHAMRLLQSIRKPFTIVPRSSRYMLPLPAYSRSGRFYLSSTLLVELENTKRKAQDRKLTHNTLETSDWHGYSYRPLVWQINLLLCCS